MADIAAAVGSVLVKNPIETPPVVIATPSLSRKVPNALPIPMVAAWIEDPATIPSEQITTFNLFFVFFIRIYLYFLVIIDL